MTESVQQTAPEDQQPGQWWCRLRHPAWCVTPHEDAEAGDCLSGWHRHLRLTLYDVVCIQSGHVPVSLTVSLAQRVRECVARVVMAPDPEIAGTRYKLTAKEAQQGAKALLDAVMRIDGQSEAHTGPGGRDHDADDGTRLPFWWQHHRPHPGWCWIEHGDADSDGDRVCLSSSRELRPSLPDAAQTHDDDSGQTGSNGVEVLSVYLIQAYREYAPRVIITPQFLYEGSRYELTRDEAEQLAQALLEAACILDGPQPVEHCVSEPD